jgi:L-fuculose-phosphate aldolase
MTRYVENAEEAVLAAAKELLDKGLVEGTAGNLSARREDGSIVMTPSSVDYKDMTLDDLCIVDLDGEIISAKEGRMPTSEKALHLACFKHFDDVGAVIHSHAVHASMFAVARKPIPPCIDEFTIFVGGEVRVAEYGPSASDELAEHAVAALEDRGAVLLANHGMVAVGPSPAKALHITALVERTAQIVWGAHALGPIHSLPEKVNRNFGNVYKYLRENPM